MQAHFDVEPIYPRSRAFLIQIHRDADLSSGHCIGRVEQVSAYGDAVVFFSASDLLAFLQSRLAETAPPDTVAEHRGLGNET